MEGRAGRGGCGEGGTAMMLELTPCCCYYCNRWAILSPHTFCHAMWYMTTRAPAHKRVVYLSRMLISNMPSRHHRCLTDALHLSPPNLGKTTHRACLTDVRKPRPARNCCLHASPSCIPDTTVYNAVQSICSEFSIGGGGFSLLLVQCL